jgi:hypothetical protein
MGKDLTEPSRFFSEVRAILAEARGAAVRVVEAAGVLASFHLQKDSILNTFIFPLDGWKLGSIKATSVCLTTPHNSSTSSIRMVRRSKDNDRHAQSP